MISKKMIIYIFLNISYILFSNKHMKWTEPHDIYFLREMMLCQPWEHKKGSTERGETWARLAANLSKCSKLVFHVTQRSLRDRYLLLERKHKKKVFDEENASGISPEDTEIEQLMNEIVDLFEESDQFEKDKKKKLEEEAADIEEMRKASLESFRETKERKRQRSPSKKKTRTSGASAISFIREKVAIEGEQKKSELQLKREEMEWKKEEKKMEMVLKEKEIEMRKEEHKERVKQQEEAIRMQEQTLQQMHSMNMAMLQQQQQQTQVLLTLLQKFADK